jgi:hypothetical protein
MENNFFPWTIVAALDFRTLLVLLSSLPGTFDCLEVARVPESVGTSPRFKHLPIF